MEAPAAHAAPLLLYRVVLGVKTGKQAATAPTECPSLFEGFFWRHIAAKVDQSAVDGSGGRGCTGTETITAPNGSLDRELDGKNRKWRTLVSRWVDAAAASCCCCCCVVIGTSSSQQNKPVSWPLTSCVSLSLCLSLSLYQSSSRQCGFIDM